MAAKKGAETKSNEVKTRGREKTVPEATETEKRPVGAPVKHTDQELIEGIEQYIAEWWAGKKATPPSIYWCVVHMGISRSSLYDRASKCPELMDTLERLKDLAKAVIIDGALTGKYNSQMGKFCLCNLGMTDQPQQEQQADNEIKVIIEKAEYGD